MKITGIKTRVFRIGENIFDFLYAALEANNICLHERCVLVVTSKIVSLAEGRIVKRAQGQTKGDLITAEAEMDLGPLKQSSRLTLKHGLLLPSAGIDESNSETGDFILLPKDPWDWAKKIHFELTQKLNLDFLGIVITDSRSQPLRRGISGVALAHAGFKGVVSRVGQKDLFGRPLSMTQINCIDPLAAAAVFEMGEADEARPLAWIEDLNLEFLSREQTRTFDFKNEIQIPPKDDMYANQIEMMRALAT